MSAALSSRPATAPLTRTLPHGRGGEGEDAKLISRIRAARDAVAVLVADDPVYLPIFERLELELEAAMAADDPIRRARAIARRYSAIS
jgi:hypothetical protein